MRNLCHITNNNDIGSSDHIPKPNEFVALKLRKVVSCFVDEILRTKNSNGVFNPCCPKSSCSMRYAPQAKLTH